VQAMLPHVDAHYPVHNLESLEAFGRALREAPPERAPSRAGFAAAASDPTTQGAIRWS
jgi:hypothetical protein